MARTLRDFQVESVANGFSDKLNDSSLHSNWTEDITDVTGDDPVITEDGTALTISYVGGQSLVWNWPASPNAPCVTLPIEWINFTVKVYVSGIQTGSLNNQNGGMLVVSSAGKSQFTNLTFSNNNTFDLVMSHSGGVDNEQSTIFGDHTGECWLAMARRGDKMILCYSRNAVTNEPDFDDMDYHRVLDTQHTPPASISLAALCSGTQNPAISIEFRKFRLTYP
jgi:hypothetical protein